MSSTLRTSSGRSKDRWWACVGNPLEEIEYVGPAESLQQVWIALRAQLAKVLKHVTISDVAAGKLPKDALALTARRGSLGDSLAGTVPLVATRTRGAHSASRRRARNPETRSLLSPV